MGNITSNNNRVIIRCKINNEWPDIHDVITFRHESGWDPSPSATDCNKCSQPPEKYGSEPVHTQCFFRRARPRPKRVVVSQPPLLDLAICQPRHRRIRSFFSFFFFYTLLSSVQTKQQGSVKAVAVQLSPNLGPKQKILNFRPSWQVLAPSYRLFSFID